MNVHVVQVMNQFVSAPHHVHCVVILCILRYFQGTLPYPFLFSFTSKVELFAYTDIDWVDDSNAPCSTSLCVFLDNCPLLEKQEIRQLLIQVLR